MLNQALKYIDNKSKQLIYNNLSPGLSIVITNSNTNVFMQNYGLSDIDNNIPMTSNTSILLASVSKLLSIVTLITLQKHNPSVDIFHTNIIIPNHPISLTISDLILHMSGIPEQYGTFNELIGYSRKEIIDNLVNVPNQGFHTAYNYTNIPFTYGIEKALSLLDMSLEEGYNYLFNLIDMKQSSIDYYPGKYKGYFITDNTWYPVSEYDVSEQVAAGGIYSTTHDMSKFTRFFLNNHTWLLENNIFFDLSKDIIVFSGALENVRTCLAINIKLDLAIFVSSNSSPNGLPEGIVSSFFSILNGSSTSDANTSFLLKCNDINSYLKNIFPPISSNYIIYRNICDCAISGKYKNNIYQDLEITSSNNIILGKLNPVPLYQRHNNDYCFILYNKSKLPYYGKLIIISKSSIMITYYGQTIIYNKMSSS